LSLKDGSVMPGWPIDVTDVLRSVQQSFNSRDQNQRGALTILEGMLYVPFGGHFGDCGNYHGWVVGASLREPRRVAAWSTRARGGGIWAPGGISVAGQSLLMATGNTSVSRPGGTVRLCSVLLRTCIDRARSATSLRRRTGFR
jgi:hypothetical protein